MTTTTDAIVADYLARLDAASAGLPPDRRAELREGIAEHIDAALAGGSADDEVAVRGVLDRLGAPEEIAAAATDDAPTLVIRRRGTGLELAAVLMLTVGSLLPLLGWLVGVGLLWASPLWRLREKLVGTLVVPLGPGAAILAGGLLPFGAAEVCTGAPDGSISCLSDGPPGWIYPVVLVVVLIAPIVVAVWLFRTATRRAEQEAPAAVQTRTTPWGGLEVTGVLLLGLGGVLLLFLGPLMLVGPVVGLVLVCCSTRWTGTQKAVAGALAVAPAVVLGAALAPSGVVAAPRTAALLGWLIGPAIAGGYLTAVLGRRR